MDGLRRTAIRAGALLAALLSPAIVVFGVPFAFGIVSDITAATGPQSVPLALEVAAAILLWRLVRRPPLYTANSMT